MAALALPLTFMPERQGPPTPEDVSMIRMLSAFWKGEDKSKVLVVSDAFGFVDELRRVGLKAWQFSPFGKVSRYQVQGDLVASPIKAGSLNVVWVPNVAIKLPDLFSMMPMVRLAGFLIGMMPKEAERYLSLAGFTPMLNAVGPYEVWILMRTA